MNFLQRKFHRKYLRVLFVVFLCLLGVPGQGLTATFRARLQAAYDTYKASPLHYKVFALKQDDERFDAWYTWGYDDLDFAISDALAKCGQGDHVVGKCLTYALGDEVVISLDHDKLNRKIEEYRLEGMRRRYYPQPGNDKTVGLGFSGDGRFFVTSLAGNKQSQVFFYENDTQVWRYTSVVKNKGALEMGRNFAVSFDAGMHASALFIQDSIADIGRSVVRIEHFQPGKVTEIELQNDAFLNDACGLAFSPNGKELAVCLDAEVASRIERYDVSTGKRLSSFDSNKVNGRFEKHLAYGPSGENLLVRGGRYQFDWVLKKKSKEADIVWLFDKKSGEQLRSLEFPLGPGLRGPEDVRISKDGAYIIVSELAGIRLLPIDSSKKAQEFSLALSPQCQVEISPHSIVGLVDQGKFKRFTVGMSGLKLLDERPVAPQGTLLTFDVVSDAWRVVDAGKIRTVAALIKTDMENVALFNKARKFFAGNEYAKGLEQLKAIVSLQPYLPLDFNGSEFYFKYPDMPLALWGDYFAFHAQAILDKSPMVSRLGLDFKRDPKSGFLYTTLAKVAGNSPAILAGLQPGDKVIAINGKPISMASQIQEIVGPLPVATRVNVSFVRGGTQGSVELITEKGFRDTGKAAQVLLSLFDYGQLAAEAGHPGLTRQAAVKLRFIAARYPSSFRTDLVEKIAVSLEALAMAHEENTKAAFELLFDKGQPHPFPFRFYNTRVWWPFYSDRGRLAEYLGVKVEKLPMAVSSAGRNKHQDYRDLDGVMIPALQIPALVR
jgi:hypothetical protein